MTDWFRVDEVSPEISGDWSVDHDTCMACGAPPVQAPDLMAFGSNFRGAAPGDVQCYFKRQPTSPDENERACRAAEVSCCNALRYAGPDPLIRARLDALALPAPEDTSRPQWKPARWVWVAIIL